jgi:replicative DNA helicase
MSITNQTYLDLDKDVIHHLVIPESIGVLQAEQFNTDLLEDDLAKAVLDWQFNHIREHGKPATATVLADEFPTVEINEPETAIGDLVSRVRERYMRTYGRDIIRHLAEQANVDPLSVSREMLRAGRELADLTLKRGEIFGSGDYHRAMALYDKRAVKGRGPSIGFKEVDDHFNGMQGVTFLIAAPKTYKSWFTINATYNNIITNDDHFPYLYSLELPADESDMRLRCMAANVPYWKYLKNCLMPEDREAIKNASEKMDDRGKFKIEKPNQGERGVQRMVERALNAGATSIFIDQLQYIENRKGHNLGAVNNTGDYFEVVNDLRNYSDEIPIFIVHQFNRSVMSSKEMPEMQQGKGSSAIEEVATLALGLWANKEMRQNNVIELGTLASRNYSYQNWRLGVHLSHGCQFTMEGPVDDDE